MCPVTKIESFISLIAGCPPILLLLIVGKCQCDGKASVISYELFFFGEQEDNWFLERK